MNKQTTKVLLVDDEPHILVALEYLVKQEGYQVFKASDGESALDLVQQQSPQIVVLDVMMPGIDGFEVARRIRNTPEHQDTRIIFLTEVYLTKPFDNKELINTINEVVEFG